MGLGQHFPRFNGLQHGPHVVLVLLRQLDIAVQGLAVHAVGFGDGLDPLREGLGQVAQGQRQINAARQERPRVLGVLEEFRFPVARGREDNQDMPRQTFQKHQELPYGVFPQAVGLIHDIGPAPFAKGP